MKFEVRVGSQFPPSRDGTARGIRRPTQEALEGMRAFLWPALMAAETMGLGSAGGSRAAHESEIFLDLVDESCPELLLLSVHRKNRHTRTKSHDQMTTVTRFEAAACFRSHRLNSRLVTSPRCFVSSASMIPRSC